MLAPRKPSALSEPRRSQNQPASASARPSTTTVCRQCQDASVKLKLGTPIDLVCKSWLVFLIQNTSFQHEKVHFRPHEATVAVFGSADNRLAAHVETSVDDDRTPSLLAKSFDDFPVERIRFPSDGLNAR